MNADTQPSAPCLYVLHWQGQNIEHAWTWPDTVQEVHLGELMHSAGVQLPQDMQADAQRWTLRRDLNNPDNHWQLSHQCITLQCTHNGQIFPRGQIVALQDGDLFEAGLCRLGLLYPPNRAPVQALDPADPIQALQDLTNLAKHHAPAWFNDNAAYPSDNDLFELLGQEQPTSSQDKGDTAHAQTQPDSWHVGVDLTNGGLQHDPILQSLHTAYLQHLQDPLNSATQDDWEVIKALSQAQTDPLAELKIRGQAKATLSDLLGLHDGIEQVLDQLQTEGPVDILSPAKPDNVMQLFAPKVWQSTQQRQLPAVNQQDHHGLALDSAMPWHSAQPNPSKT
jgi:hypothetical protein